MEKAQHDACPDTFRTRRWRATRNRGIPAIASQPSQPKSDKIIIRAPQHFLPSHTFWQWRQCTVNSKAKLQQESPEVLLNTASSEALSHCKA
jgi:hypothetical protein